MKRILFIAPASIPMTGAEAICNVKLLRALLKEGYCIDLVSRKYMYQHYPPSQMEDLGIQVDSLHVVAVDNKFTLKVIWQHIMTFLTFGFVFKGAHWSYSALSVVKELCRKNKYDAVITKNFPSEMLGAYLKKKYGLRWIATWNDPYPQERYPEPYGHGPQTPLHWLKRPLIKLMETADVHVFPNSRLSRYMCQYLEINKSKIAIIPHIVEKQVSGVRDTDDCLRLIHTGDLKLPRDATSFIKAFAQFVRQEEETNGTVNVHMTFQGVMPDTVRELVAKEGLDGYTTILPPSTYEESKKTMRDNNIVVIVEAPCAEGIFLPTKVGEAMQSGKPIFAVSPAVGVLNDLYVEGAVGYFAIINDVDGIKAEIERVYSDFKNRSLPAVRAKEDYSEQHVVNQYKVLLNV